MGDWFPRLPRQGAAGGGGGKRIVKKQQQQQRDDDGGGKGGGSSKNPFSRFNAPGTASESSDDELHALINSEVHIRPPSPTISKRPGSTPNARSPQDAWVVPAKGPSSVPGGSGGREGLLKARAKLQPQPQQPSSSSSSVAGAASSESETEGGGGGKKWGRLRKRREADSDEEEEADPLVSPPGGRGKKKKGAKKDEGGGEVLVIDLDNASPAAPAVAVSASASLEGDASSSASGSAASKRPKLGPASSSSLEAAATAPVEVVVGDSSSDEAGSAAGGGAAGRVVNVESDDEDGEEEGVGDWEYDDEERAERARARGMLRACELISEKIRKEVASWGQDQDKQKQHAEDRLDLTTMAPGGSGGSWGGKTEFVKAELLAKACPGVELKAYQLTGLNWLYLLHQLDLSDIPRDLLPGGGAGGKKRRRDGGGEGKAEEPLRLNGILADDMGLGKTCQTIAFLAYLRELQPDTHTHLVVVPASVLSNWEQELARFAPNLEVWVYHGGAKERKALRMEYEEASHRFREHVVDVVLATYSYWEKEACGDDRRFLDKLPIEYLILDEGHSVKNTASGRFARLRRQRAGRRLVLSGTPVQNHVAEMLALLGWLNPRIVDWGEEGSPDRMWELLASGSGGKGGERAAMARLKRVFAPFVLRRLKADVLDQLTAKTTAVESVVLTEAQRQTYDAVTRRHLRAAQEAASRRAAEELGQQEVLVLSVPDDDDEEEEEEEEAGDGEDGKRKRVLRSAVAAAAAAGKVEGAAALAVAPVSEKEAGNIFAEWRKAASHPLLLRRRFSGQQVGHMASVLHRTGYYGWDCSLEMVRKELEGLCDFELHSIVRDVPQLQSMALPQDALFDAAKCRRLRELVPQLIQEGHRVLLFSAWTRVLDILQLLFDEVLQLPCLRLDGSTPVAERQALIDQYNAPDSPFPVFLLSTRAGGMGINLTSADTVILYDTDWNPAVNDQAVDRCHRIGQTRPVAVYVLVAADTVDETIYKRAAGKKEKSETLLDKGDAEGEGGANGTGGRRDASGSSEISRIVQKELQAYLEHRKNLATPDSEEGSEDGSAGGDNGDGESYMEEDKEGLVELVTVDDDDDEGEGSEKSKKGAAGAGGVRPPSRASSSGTSRRESTGSVNSAGSRKRHSYSLLESIVDSEESEED